MIFFFLRKNHAKRLAITYVNFLKRKIIDGRQAFNLGEDKNESDLRFLWLTLPKATSKEFQTTFLEAPRLMGQRQFLLHQLCTCQALEKTLMPKTPPLPRRHARSLAGRAGAFRALHALEICTGPSSLGSHAFSDGPTEIYGNPSRCAGQIKTRVEDPEQNLFLSSQFSQLA